MNTDLNKNIGRLKVSFTLAGIGALLCVFYAVISLIHVFSPTFLYFLTKIQTYLLFGGMALWGACMIFSGILVRNFKGRHPGILVGGIAILVWALALFAEWYSDNHYLGLSAKFPVLFTYILLVLKFGCPIFFYFAVRNNHEKESDFLRTLSFGVLLVLLCQVVDFVAFKVFTGISSDLTFNLWALVAMNHKFFTIAMIVLSIFGYVVCVFGFNSSSNYVIQLSEDAENDEVLDEIPVLPVIEEEVAFVSFDYKRKERQARNRFKEENPIGSEETQWDNFKPKYVDPRNYAPRRQVSSEVELSYTDNNFVKDQSQEGTQMPNVSETDEATAMKDINNESSSQLTPPTSNQSGEADILDDVL